MIEKSGEYNEILIEHTYMLVFLLQIKKILSEEHYNDISKKIKYEYLKKEALNYPFYNEKDYIKKYLECTNFQ